MNGSARDLLARRVFWTLVAAWLVMIVTMLLVLYTGNRMMDKHAPLVDAAMELKLELTTAHLWLEEIMTGDRIAQLDDVWKHFNAAKWYAEAMLAGGHNLERTILPLSDSQSRESVEQIRTKLAEFRELTQRRWDVGQSGRAGSEIDQQYDDMFEELIQLTDEVETRILGMIATETKTFRWLQVFLIGGSLVLAVFIGKVFQGYVADRQRAEQQAHEMQAKLLQSEQQQKQHVEAELEKVRDQLVRQTRLATIGQVSASIGHELRGPLGAIRNAVFLLKRKAPPERTEWIGKLDLIDREIVAADRVITELKAMSQGKQPDKKPVPLGPIISAARGRVAARESVEWHVSCEPDPFVVHGDADQLQQVLKNLFANAIRAMGAKGRVTVEATRSDEYDQILVCDDGPGIPAEQRGQVFEPLFTGRSNGTGLGLTICRQIIQRHGGTIDVVDSPQGAAFLIRLPRPEESNSTV